MISASDFYNIHLNDSVEDLIVLRTHLLMQLADFERKYIIKKYYIEDIEDKVPDSKDRYIMNNKYLIEVTKLIIANEKEYDTKIRVE